jgi:hypothetical protein
MAKRLTSVFTDDMDSCIFTGSNCVERHHIFGGSSRVMSEQYGFVVPLRPDLHPNGVHANPKHSKEIDDHLKQMAQEYYEDHYGSRESFIRAFGRSYL